MIDASLSNKYRGNKSTYFYCLLWNHRESFFPYASSFSSSYPPTVSLLTWLRKVNVLFNFLCLFCYFICHLDIFLFSILPQVSTLNTHTHTQISMHKYIDNFICSVPILCGFVFSNLAAGLDFLFPLISLIFFSNSRNRRSAISINIQVYLEFFNLWFEWGIFQCVFRIKCSRYCS